MKKITSIFLLIFHNYLLCQALKCGEVKYSSGLIIKGIEVKPGEYPFLVAIKRLADQKVICGGSLITKSHALTGAHCIHEKFKYTRLYPEDIKVLLGKYNLSMNNEISAVEKEVSDIIIHDDWNTNIERYDADIAILEFVDEVSLSNFINTVCLPKVFRSNSLQPGEVVGWGMSERTKPTEMENIARKTKISKFPSNEVCFLEDEFYSKISSSRTFCAGGESTGPCFGDSGSGLYSKLDARWHLQGIVSTTVLSAHSSICDTSKYAVYTNVAHYYDWILKNTKKVKLIKLSCSFSYSEKLKSTQYKCILDGEMAVPTDDYYINEISGNHMSNKNNNDVTLLDFNSKQPSNIRDVHYIPNGIGEIFPNLQILFIQNCKLKSLSRENFENMRFVTTISLAKNHIENIDPDTFYDVPMLYSLRLNTNRIQALSDDLFIHTPKLQNVVLSTNLLKKFNSRIFRNSKDLRSLDLSFNRLQNIYIDFPEFKNLKMVDLRNNECINELFVNFRSLDNLRNNIQMNCSKQTDEEKIFNEIFSDF